MRRSGADAAELVRCATAVHVVAVAIDGMIVAVEIDEVDRYRSQKTHQRELNLVVVADARPTSPR
jgi:hypothetical protein